MGLRTFRTMTILLTKTIQVEFKSVRDKSIHLSKEDLLISEKKTTDSMNSLPNVKITNIHSLPNAARYHTRKLTLCYFLLMFLTLPQTPVSHQLVHFYFIFFVAFTVIYFLPCSYLTQSRAKRLYV
jgi:hypothetical protein